MAACVQTACPKCKASFEKSSLLEKTESQLKLNCRDCSSDYYLENCTNQRSYLTSNSRAPFGYQKLNDINLLLEGDVITFYRTAWLVKYMHYAIVMSINKESGLVTVVEFSKHLPLRWGYVVKEEKDFKSCIADECGEIQHYKPLDCLSVPEVVDRANMFISQVKSTPAFGIGTDCKNLASWCKTGNLKT